MPMAFWAAATLFGFLISTTASATTSSSRCLCSSGSGELRMVRRTCLISATWAGSPSLSVRARTGSTMVSSACIAAFASDNASVNRTSPRASRAAVRRSSATSIWDAPGLSRAYSRRRKSARSIIVMARAFWLRSSCTLSLRLLSSCPTIVSYLVTSLRISSLSTASAATSYSGMETASIASLTALSSSSWVLWISRRSASATNLSASVSGTGMRSPSFSWSRAWMRSLCVKYRSSAGWRLGSSLNALAILMPRESVIGSSSCSGEGRDQGLEDLDLLGV